jgi:uncharacterized protein
MKIIKDPVHGYIEVDDTALRILDSPGLQRLRHIKQLGFSYLVYPGANHTRFEHSLGTMHLAAMMCRQLSLDTANTRLVAASALLHDIGHGPYSHAIEPFMKEFLGTEHHELSCQLIREGAVAETLVDAGIDPDDASAMVQGTHPLACIIQGDLDVDRMDYLMRDAHYTGVPYGTVDADRLIQSSLLQGSSVILDESGINAAESLLIARTLMRPSVYYHHVSRIAASMLKHALLMHREDGGDPNVDVLMHMDDGLLLQTLRHSKSEVARAMAERLYHRKLFKRALYVGGVQVNAAALQRENSLLAGRRYAQAIADHAGVEESCVLVDIPAMPSEMSMSVQIKNRDEILGLEGISPLVYTLNETRRRQWRLGVYTLPEHRSSVEAAAVEVLHVKRATKQDRLSFD